MAQKSYTELNAKRQSRKQLRRRLAKFEQGNSFNLIGYIIDRIRAHVAGI